MNFSVIASFKVALEARELFEESLANLAAKTQQEPGCIEYEVHKNSEIDGSYFIIEKYLTYEDYVAHRESAYILEFKAVVGNIFIQPPVVFRGSKAF